MTLKLIICGLLLPSMTSFGQTTKDKLIDKPLTSKYAGTYSYGNDIEKEGTGTILIYPDTDTTVLFYIDVNRGAPSYNMGSLYGRVTIINGAGTFFVRLFPNDNGCKWTFQFINENLTIKTIKEFYNCGFGHGVYADGKFKRLSKKAPEYFEQQDGQKIFFKNTTPKQYYNN